MHAEALEAFREWEASFIKTLVSLPALRRVHNYFTAIVTPDWLLSPPARK